MDDIRVGLVGLGHRGLHWLRLLQRLRGYRITAVCDPIAALHERALAAVENPARAYAVYDDILADDNVDAIALCVRCREQGALAAMALEAGKHVNSEVPAAHTLEDCWRIVTQVERTGLVYQLAEQTRYWGFVDTWRDLVARGRLGRVTFCEGQYIGYYGTRQFFQDHGHRRIPFRRAVGRARKRPDRPGSTKCRPSTTFPTNSAPCSGYWTTAWWK